MLAVWALPAMLGGLACGSLLTGRISRSAVLHIVWAILAAAGVRLVIG